MKRLLRMGVFIFVLGLILWGCNNAFDHGAYEVQKDGLAEKGQLVLAHGLFGGRVDAVLPYLYKPYGIASRNEQKPYFFNGENYNRIKFEPSSNEDKLLTNTAKITSGWPSLKEAGFDRVDATLPITRNEDENIAYFFKDDEYIKVKYTYGKWNDELLTRPTKITSGWPSLKEAGFTRVDAAFPSYISSGGPVVAYIFSGDSYVEIALDQDLNDKIISGPTKIADGWPTLRKAGFTTVDAVLAVNGYPNVSGTYTWHRIYVFSGDRYLYMKFKPGGDEELISGPGEIYFGWPHLR